MIVGGLTLVSHSRVDIPATSLVVGSWGDERGVTFASARAEGRHHWIDWPGVGVFAFETGSTVVRVECQRPAAEVRDLFDRVVQPIVLQALGRQALHASGVWGAGGVVAFCGRGRSGKSTLAYALAKAGFPQLADDALLIDEIGADVLVRPLPFVPQLRPASRQHFDREAADPCPRDPSLPAVLPLRAIFILAQDTAAPVSPVIERVPPVAAFTTLLRHAHCFDQRPSVQARTLVDDYLRVVERVPVFSLTYAPMFDGLDALVRAVTDTASTIDVHALDREPEGIRR